MAHDVARVVQATESGKEAADTLVVPEAPKWSKLIICGDDKEPYKFRWSDAGRHGVLVLRRWVFLQHLSKAGHGQGASPSSVSPYSGPARCVSLVQDGPDCGYLARAAAAFQEAALTELQRVALRELQDCAAVMEPLDQPGVVGDGSMTLAVLHMWRRCPMWLSLQRAPADLMGDLNDALVGELAQGSRAALHNVMAALIDGWRLGLAQLGDQLARRVEQGADHVLGQREDVSVAGGPGSEKRAENGIVKWLLWWRLYLWLHRQMEVWAKSQRGAPLLDPHLCSDSNADIDAKQEGRLSARHVDRWPAHGKSCHHPPVPPSSLAAACVDGASGGKTHGHAGRHHPAVYAGDEAMPSGAVPQPPPALLASFLSAYARRVAKATLELSDTAVGAPRNPLAPRCPSRTSANGSLSGGRQQLRWACLQMLRQLGEVLADDLSEEDVVCRIQQLTVTRGDSNLTGSHKVAPAFSAASALLSRPDRATLSASDRGDSWLNAPSRPTSLLSSEPSRKSALDAVALAPVPSRNGPVVGAHGGAAELPDTAAVLPVDVLSELRPERILRLSNSPGLLSLQLQLTQSLRSSVGEVLPGPNRPSAATEDKSARHARRAALLQGVCWSLHQIHRQLEKVYCVCCLSGLTAEEMASLCDREFQGLVGSRCAPVLSPCCDLQRLPVEPVSSRVEAVSTAVGAAALAAVSARPLPTADSTWALRAAAFTHADAWVAARPTKKCSGSRSGDCHRGADSGGAAAPACVGTASVTTVKGRITEASGINATWACEVERLTSALLAGGLHRKCGSRDLVAEATSACASAAIAEGGVNHASGDGGVYSQCDHASAGLIRGALLLYAGLVRLLGTLLGAAPTINPRGMPLYRWAKPDPTDVVAEAAARASVADCAADTPATVTDASYTSSASAALTQPITSGYLHNGALELHQGHHLGSSTARSLLFHMAVSACTVMANRLVHVTKTHAPGSGANLRPLCVAHSDTATLWSAAHALLALVTFAAVGSSQVGNPPPRFWRCRRTPFGGASQSLPRGETVPREVGEHSSSMSGAVMDPHTFPSCSMESALAAAGTGAQGAQGSARRPSRKLNWRRSLRRIMPYRTERSSSHDSSQSLLRDRSASGQGADLGQPIAGTQRKSVRRACWAGEPIEPVPLPAPAPLCSIAAPHLEAAEAAHARAKTAPLLRRWPFSETTPAAVHGPNVAVGGGSMCSGLADTRNHWKKPDGSSGGSGNTCIVGMGSSHTKLGGSKRSQGGSGMRQQQRLAGQGLLVLSDAELGLMQVLHEACGQLRAATMRAGDLVAAEMGQRAAVICRSSAGSYDSQVLPSAAQQVIASLLKPLREALEGLHPVSQSELLTRGFSAVVQALRQHYLGGIRGGGRDKRNESGLAGQELGKGLTLLEAELAAGWRQLGAAFGCDGCQVDTPVAAWVAGDYEFAKARTEMDALIQSLRNDIGTMG
ncbi:hypothetical protein VaNZ11_000244 [Volvox africanus]|uniref:Uncharacterized protein n=1 Tax=Volvox africanus TaxID=51714 RepID=A0ABQ5RMJ0_9CHLO|nr:hypothetical protein VaNZ11_000244 [Volvox africanus]